MEMSTEEVSAIAACIAALVAIGSLIVAKKALNIERRREERLRLPFDLYLVDAMHITQGNMRVLIFLITITNNSDTDISINSPTLNVLYTDSNNSLKKLKIKHDKSLEKKYDLKDYSFSDNHPFIPAHKTISSGLIFEMDDKLLQDCLFEKYEIKIEDYRGHVEKLDSIITHEIVENEEI